LAPQETLLTLAEIGIAVIGFAGILSALRPSRSTHADAMHSLRLRIMVEASAYVMLFCFVPLLVVSDDAGDPRVWAAGSALLAVAAPVLVASIYTRQRRIFGSMLLRETLLFDALTIALAAISEVVLILNASQVLFPARFAGYLVGLLFLLGAAVAMFVRAIFASTVEGPGGLDSREGD